MRLKNRGEMGIGTLIIFVSLILMTAIAAGVVMSMTGSLQNKALITGRATTGETSTAIIMMEAFGGDGRNEVINYWYYIMKLSSGAEALRLDETLLSTSMSEDDNSYQYDANINCYNQTNVSSYNNGFGVVYEIKGSFYKNGYMNIGDVVTFCHKAFRNILPGETSMATFTPIMGVPLKTEITLPMVIADERIALYP